MDGLRVVLKGWGYILAFCIVIAAFCAPAFLLQAFVSDTAGVIYTALLFVIAISALIYTVDALYRDGK